MHGLGTTLSEEIKTLERRIDIFKRVLRGGDVDDVRGYIAQDRHKGNMTIRECESGLCGNNIRGKCSCPNVSLKLTFNGLECLSKCDKGEGYLEKVLRDLEEELGAMKERLAIKNI